MVGVIIFTLCTGLSMGAFILLNAYMDRDTNRIFLWCIFLMIILLPVSYFEQEWSLLTEYSFGRAVMTALGYSIRPAIPFLIFIRLARTDTLKSWLLSIPLWLNAIMSFLSLHIGVIFSFTADNQFVRGPLNLLTFYTGFLYLIGIALYSFIFYSKHRSGEIYICIGIVIQLSLAMVIEVFFGMKNLLAYFIPMALLDYYMYLFTMRFRVDQMTGAFTQNSFEMDRRRIEHCKTCGIISVDLNDLKIINDTLGHTEGNRRICLIANLMQTALSRRTRVYRVGGDEFIAILYHIKPDALAGRVKRLRLKLELAKCSTAVGSSFYERGKGSLDDALLAADREMYIDKSRIKAVQHRSDSIAG